MGRWACCCGVCSILGEGSLLYPTMDIELDSEGATKQYMQAKMDLRYGHQTVQVGSNKNEYRSI